MFFPFIKLKKIFNRNFIFLDKLKFFKTERKDKFNICFPHKYCLHDEILLTLKNAMFQKLQIDCSIIIKYVGNMPDSRKCLKVRVPSCDSTMLYDKYIENLLHCIFHVLFIVSYIKESLMIW